MSSSVLMLKPNFEVAAVSLLNNAKVAIAN